MQLDYYGKRLASAGSDRRVKIFDVGADGQRVLTADLTGHEGPVWMLAWAHPEYGPILASCSYDRQVIVWKEHAPAQWSPVHKFLGHEGSVNAIAFCPREYGLRLACASSDENVSVLTYHGEGYWSSVMFKAHKTGCNAVAWRPDAKADATQDGMRLLTGGCDNLIKIWRWAAAAHGDAAPRRPRAFVRPHHAYAAHTCAYAPHIRACAAHTTRAGTRRRQRHG